MLLSTPDGFEGIVSFNYTVSDGNGGLSPAYVELAIIPNHAPVVAGVIGPQTSAEDETWSYAVPAGLFTDADNQPLTLSARLSGGAPLPAWLVFDALTRTFTGTPPQNFHGQVSIEVVASDGLNATPAAFVLTISPVNDGPLAGADGVFETAATTSITIAASALLANDSDADGDVLTIVSVQGATNGTVVLDGTGNAIFTPVSGYQGPAAFTYTVSDGHGGTSTAGVSILVGGGVQGVTITGTALAESLIGGAGNDTIEGRGGNDTMSGLGGDDVFLIAGNDGLDTFDGGQGFDTIKGGTDNDIIGLLNGSLSLVSVESIDGGAGDDILRLNTGADVLDLSAIAVTSIEEIRGLGGNDTITGSSGDDVINGGGGNDLLAGGGGNDRFLVAVNNGYDSFDGGSGFDRIAGGAGDDLIGLLSGSASLASIEELDGGAGFDVLRLSAAADVLDLSLLDVIGIEEVRGQGGNDTIIGTSQADTINGGAGNDSLSGGDGDDVFLAAGGTGYDELDGGAGFDKVLGSSGNDTISLAHGNFSLLSIEAIDGGAGTDTLRLTAGDDVLDLSGFLVSGIEFVSALAGNDTITASSASESIRGGGGNDQFIFLTGTGHDVIADFQRGSAVSPVVDVINLKAFGFTDFADLMTHAALVGTDTVITIDAETSLTIANLAPSLLKADDFILA